MKKFAILLIITIVSLNLFSKTDKPFLLSLLKENNAKYYSEYQNFGKGLDAVFLGYDKDKNTILALAVKKTKTYKKTDIIVLITSKNNNYTIKQVVIPEITNFTKKSKSSANKAINALKGISFKNENETKSLIDAVSGATKYYKAIYISTSIMAKNLIKEITLKTNQKIKPL